MSVTRRQVITAVACSTIATAGILAIWADSENVAPWNTDPTYAAEVAGTGYDVPGAADFSVTLNVSSRECFGSAGCLVDYTVSVHAETDVYLNPDVTYTLTYEIPEAEDSYVKSVEVRGGQYSISTEMVSTASDDPLTANVLSVQESPW